MYDVRGVCVGAGLCIIQAPWHDLKPSSQGLTCEGAPLACNMEAGGMDQAEDITTTVWFVRPSCGPNRPPMHSCEVNSSTKHLFLTVAACRLSP